MNPAPIPEDPDLIFSESELDAVNRFEIPGTNQERSSKKKHFYTPAEDLELLREVYCTRPFIAPYKDTPKKWSDCLVHLGWNFGVRSIRQRYETLYSSFLSAERKSAKSSGTEEVFDEKIKLLGHIKELIDAASLEKLKTTKRKLEVDELDKTKAHDIRNAAMNGMSRKDKLEPVSSAPQLKTKTDVNSENQEVNNLLKKKLEDEFKFREDELKFKREKLSAMAEEREKDRELEYRRLQLQESSQKQQHALMMELLSQNQGLKVAPLATTDSSRLCNSVIALFVTFATIAFNVLTY